MADINSFDDGAVRRIAETVRRLEAQVRNLTGTVRQLLISQNPGTPAVQVRTGKTSTGPDDETYPTDGCKFWVQLQDWGWDEATGDCDQEEDNHASRYVLGKTYNGEHLAADTLVIVVRIAGIEGPRYLIVPACLEIMIGKLDGSLSDGSSATMSEWQRNSGDTAWEDSTINHTVYDWLLGSGESISSGKKVVAARVRRGGKLVVIAAECE